MSNRVPARIRVRYNPYKDRGHSAEVAHYLLQQEYLNETTLAVQREISYRTWLENRFNEE